MIDLRDLNHAGTAIPNLRDEIEARAYAQGFTELRMDPETKGWAYNKPDQALGTDGRLYVRAATISGNRA